MFYNAEKINKVLLCKHCVGGLDIPKMLQCGVTICSFCETSIQVIDKMYDCLVCKQKHEMPQNGLPNNELAFEILAFEPTKVSRGEAYESLKRLLNEIQKKRNIIKLGIDNSDDLVKEHFMDLRSDVQLKVEEVILKVNDLSTKLIEEIDDHEKDIIEFNKTNSISLDAFNSIVEELDSFFALKNEYLNKNEVDDNLVKQSNEEAANMVKKAELEIENLKDIIFDGNTFKFKRNNERINRSIFGKLNTDKMMDSLILSNRNLQKQLFSLCELPLDQTSNLIYRASRNGFGATNFHSKCNDKPNTLIIIKSSNGNIFGGYTEQTWNHINITERNVLFIDNSNSFIFSLINKLNKPIKIKWSKNIGIICDSSYGPTFGKGIDLYIANKSNTNTNSFSDLGLSYSHPEYAYGSNEARSFLAGSFNFQVSEIEVYTI